MREGISLPIFQYQDDVDSLSINTNWNDRQKSFSILADIFFPKPVKTLVFQ